MDVVDSVKVRPLDGLVDQHLRLYRAQSSYSLLQHGNIQNISVAESVKCSA